MTILAVDDEKIALEELTTAIAEVAAGAEVLGFRSASEALTAAQNCGCDVAFLDIQMRELNGVELAKRFKRQSPATNIIFVTGYSEYMGDALSMHASGYLLKPVTPDKIRRELEDLRHPLPMQGGGRAQAINAYRGEYMAQYSWAEFSKNRLEIR